MLEETDNVLDTGVDVLDTEVDVLGTGVDVSGTGVDVSGTGVDVSGTGVDVLGSRVECLGCGINFEEPGLRLWILDKLGNDLKGLILSAPIGSVSRVDSNTEKNISYISHTDFAINFEI